MNHWWWSYIKSYPTPELWLCDLSYRIDGLIKQLMRQNKTILPTFHKKFFATHAWSAMLWAKLFDWIPLLHEHILYIRIHTATYYKLESFISIYRYMAKSGFTWQGSKEYTWAISCVINEELGSFFLPSYLLSLGRSVGEISCHTSWWKMQPSLWYKWKETSYSHPFFLVRNQILIMSM